VDVYVVILSLPERPRESIPVIYRGGKHVIIDRPEIRLSIDGEGGEPLGTSPEGQRNETA